MFILDGLFTETYYILQSSKPLSERAPTNRLLLEIGLLAHLLNSNAENMRCFSAIWRDMMVIDESVWQYMKERLGYDDEEMRKFRENPRNSEVLGKAHVLSNKTIIAEIVESKGCNSQHKVGDRFTFDVVGNLLTSKNPKRICIFALARLAPIIFAVDELIYAGIDPDKIKYRRTGCFDVGIDCGGWGHIVMEVKVEDRRQ